LTASVTAISIENNANVARQWSLLELMLESALVCHLGESQNFCPGGDALPAHGPGFPLIDKA
jgi:hypothetical protein